MPIDYSLYPKNWKTEIRPSILERCGHKCFFCGVKNYEVGYRDKRGTFYSAEKIIQLLEDTGYDIFSKELSHVAGDAKPIKIILTIMHLDHDIKNNDYNNLAAGCQRCHLNYDKNIHLTNSATTRNKKKKLQSLFS